MRLKYVGLTEQNVIYDVNVSSLSSCENDSELNDCWYGSVHTFDIYTSISSSAYECDHEQFVDKCVLNALLINSDLDKAAHFLLISQFSNIDNRYVSHLIVFSEYLSKVYQRNLLAELQNKCDTELIHCSCDTIHSPYWWIQNKVTNYNVCVNTVYSNCHSCLCKVDHLHKSYYTLAVLH